METNKIISLIKWGIIVILAILLLRECNKVIDKVVPEKPKNDTTISHKQDTIFQKDTIIRFKNKPIAYYIHDTVLKPVPLSAEDCSKTKIYLDTLDNKDLTVYDSIWVQGLIRRKITEYKLKVPLRIIDSVKQEIRIPTLYPPNYELHIGSLIGYNTLAPTVDLSIKRHTITVGYNIQTKQPIIGYKFTIFRK